MLNAALLINHIHFPYRLFEQSMLWAKDNQATLKIIFLTYENEGSLEDARKVIANQINDIAQQSQVHELLTQSLLLFQPSLDEILAEVKEADKIFIEIQDDESLKNLSFSWHSLMHELGRSRQIVSNKAFG